jgi:hypothetical protein
MVAGEWNVGSIMGNTVTPVILAWWWGLFTCYLLVTMCSTPGNFSNSMFHALQVNCSYEILLVLDARTLYMVLCTVFPPLLQSP